MLKRIILFSGLLCSILTAWSQIDTILWQNCLGILNGENHVHAVEKSEDGYLFGIDLEKNGPGVTNYHGKSDAWIIYTSVTGNIIWEKCFGGSEGEGSWKIIKIDENTFYLLNDSWSNDGDVLNGRAGNFWIVKINSSGDILWENSYGGCIMGEEVRDAILMPDNGLICMGRISSTGGDITTYYGNMDIWLFRIDSLGNILWEKTFGNHGVDEALKIKLTSNSTMIMIGCHDESGGMIDCPEPHSYFADVWLVEMDLYGNLLNNWCYGGKYWDQGFDIIEVTDGYVFTGITNSNDGDVSGFHGPAGENESADIWAVKVDFNGNIIWQKCLGGYSWEVPYYITETVDGAFIIIGYTTSHDGDVIGNHTTEYNEADIWIVKLSGDGQLLWEHCFGGLGTDWFRGTHGVVKKDDYNYVIGANSNHASGDVTCNLFPYEETSNAWLFEIIDCSYYMPIPPSTIISPDTVCSTVNPESLYLLETVPWATGYDWIIEPDSAGIFFLDSASIHANWNPIFEGTVTVKARSYNDCGFSAWSEPHVTQVFSCLGMNEHGGMEAWGHGGLCLWPNPASGIVDCRWPICDGRGEVALVIYDMFGGEMLVTASPSPAMGEGQGGGRRIDVSALPPGLYLVVLKDGNRIIASAKLVVAR